ncbi:MAG: hypothetical protein ACP5KZ_07985, partial [bacterium]
MRGLPKEILHNLKRDCFVASLLAMTEIPRQARERRRSLRCEWELRSNSQLTPATPFNERGIKKRRGG